MLLIISRRMQELQLKHEEEMRALQAGFDNTIQQYEEKIQKAPHLSSDMLLVSSAAPGQSPQIHRSNSVESLSYDPLPRILGAESLSHRNKECIDISREYVVSHQSDYLPLVSKIRDILSEINVRVS